jgi:hypothetical protein
MSVSGFTPCALGFTSRAISYSLSRGRTRPRVSVCFLLSAVTLYFVSRSNDFTLVRGSRSVPASQVYS